MNKFLRNSLTVLVVAVLLVLDGCGSMVNVGAKSDKFLNNSGGESTLPVVVRIYQLSDDTAFKNATFRDLWKRDTEVLGSALLSSKEIIMRPDSKEKLSVPLDEKTKFVAGFALFRNPDAVKWRFIEPVSNNFIASGWHKLFPVGISLHLGKSKIEQD
jgi:type VI secretion system VasD/TssJ family lipoprotein